MILDGHIHIDNGPEDREDFARRLREAGVDGGILLSPAPACFAGAIHTASPQERLEKALFWCEAGPNLYPFYWIDPTETDALEQVDLAVGKGVAGFKVICSTHDPGDPRALWTYQAIAEAGRPILFHSGILWDGKPSSPHNRPANFEALLDVKGLRFALAHISWPWTDECIAVYGKFQAAIRHCDDLDVEMFIDTTPGTPPIYRRDALTRLFTVGYDVSRNVMFGSDNHANAYNTAYARSWIERDRTIFAEIGIEVATINNVFGENVKRFLKI
ncbi:MAG TPA: amidohydrolase family protein [Anaerolineae bacterium]|nr:amidohydrolase family protein [Anaerolineae bacterium]HQI85608.1 amidohydrolase family protein [Anaerolineae bacterium]